jgi:FkbM family methyltransferase
MAVKIKLLPRYMLTFGPLRGVIYFILAEWLKREQLKLDGFKYTFQLRKNSTDLLVFREVFLFRSYDIAWSSPQVIIDGGGNIGLSSIFLTQKFPMAKIYTIEPSESNFEVLKANVKNYPLIIPIHSALWNRDTSLRIQNINDHQWSFAVEECQANEPGAFNAMSINTLMKKYDIKQIDILKLDIEGSEKELFTNNYDYWLSHTKCILVELHDWLKPNCSKAVFGALSKLNFKASIFNGMLMLVNTDLE